MKQFINIFFSIVLSSILIITTIVPAFALGTAVGIASLVLQGYQFLCSSSASSAQKEAAKTMVLNSWITVSESTNAVWTPIDYSELSSTVKELTQAGQPCFIKSVSHNNATLSNNGFII